MIPSPSWDHWNDRLHCHGTVPLFLPSQGDEKEKTPQTGEVSGLECRANRSADSLGPRCGLSKQQEFR